MNAIDDRIIKEYFSQVLNNGYGYRMPDSEKTYPQLTAIMKNNELSGIPVSEYGKYADTTLRYFFEISDTFLRKGLKFFAMKTFRSYPYVDTDIDIVLVDIGRKRDYIESLEDSGFKNIWNRSILREPKKRFYVKLDKDGRVIMPVIHVHFTVSWNGIDFLDAEDVWKRLRTITVDGKAVSAPSIEDELLITAAHTLHENTYITIGELLHIKNMLNEKTDIDIDYMIGISRQYNWNFSLRRYFSYLDMVHKDITGRELLSETFKRGLGIEPDRGHGTGKHGFPYFLPASTLLAGYFSKILRDLGMFKIRQIPRELLTFFIVVWLFRHKKKAAFKRDVS